MTVRTGRAPGSRPVSTVAVLVGITVKKLPLTWVGTASVLGSLEEMKYGGRPPPTVKGM